MSVLGNFRLGRPGYTTQFQLNPTAMDYTPRRIADFGRGLDGSGTDVTLSRDRPFLRINGNYITPDQFNQFASLARVGDVPLIFQPMNFEGTHLWESWAERVIPISTTQVPLPENSFTRAAQLEQYYGGHAMLKIQSLFVGLKSNQQYDGDPPYYVWQNGVGFSILDNLGIWGNILKQDFNNLPTGLLVDAGDGWIVSGGNGTTRDVFVTATPAEVLEGTKGVIFITDGVGATNLFADRRNGGHLTTLGYVGEYHIMSWTAQMVRNITGCQAHVVARGTIIANAWSVIIEVTSATTADVVVKIGVSEVHRSALATPFGPHDFVVRSENRASKGGDLIQVWVDTVSIYSSAVYIGNFNTIRFYGFAPTGGGSSTIWRLDDVHCYDGDGYDPSTGLITFVTSTPLPDLEPVFVDYTYTGIAVRLEQVPFRAEGGWVDFYRYNFQLEGM